MPRRFVCFGLLALALSLVTLPGALVAAEAKEHELALTTERVIVFKDGYCLVIKRGTAVTDDAGEVFTDDVPDAAVLGTFWAVPDEGRLVSMHAGWKTTDEAADKEFSCRETIEVLLANKGKTARVELHDKTMVNGTIREVLVDRTAVPVAVEAREAAGMVPGFSSIRSGARRLPAHVTETQTLTAITGGNFVMRTDDGDTLLAAGSVRSLSIKDMKTTVSKTARTTRHSKRLSFRLPEKQKKQSLSLMYFRPGVRWIPTYRVNLGEKNGKKVADIALQAEILNEAEDLVDVPIDIVVGVPNFRFRGTPSPLVLEATLRNALAEAAPAIMGQAMANNSFSNAMYSQRSSEFRRNAAQANDAAEGGVVNLPGELTATGSQDLFVYKLPKITLARGERSAVSIFQAECPYKDLYTWDIHVNRQDIEASPSGAGVVSPLTLSKNEVWHQVVLTNTTNLPWTTGAAMITQGNQPLSQELLTYTPPKDDCRVPVTIAIDLRGSFDEKELGRELNGMQWNGHNYARIEKEAAVHLCNNKKSEVEVEMTLRLGGKVTKATEEGTVVLGAFRQEDWTNYQGHPAVNNGSTVTWKAKLKPGETIEPKVTYHFLTRH